MNVEIRQVGVEALRRWAEVPISFRVESYFAVTEIDGGLGGLALTEKKVDEPYVKNYDLYEDEHPEGWPRFDISNWGLFQAFDGDKVIGCAAVACRSPTIRSFDGRTDLALLWDIRVVPGRRRSGVGTRAFKHAVEFARSAGYRQFKIETQNINVPACRFYAKQGCRLWDIRRHAYRKPDNAHETVLFWCLDL